MPAGDVVVLCDVVAGRRCWPQMFVDEMSAGTHEALEFAGTSINFRSGKFGYSICPFFSKGHAEIFREFWHDFAKNRTYSCVA